MRPVTHGVKLSQPFRDSALSVCIAFQSLRVQSLSGSLRSAHERSQPPRSFFRIQDLIEIRVVCNGPLVARRRFNG